MTQDEHAYRVTRIGWIKTLCSAYEQEHDWENDGDSSATHEMLTECRALADEMIAAMPKPDETVRVLVADPDLPF